MSPNASDSNPEEPLTRILPRWLVVVLTVVAFGALTLFLVGYFFSPELRRVAAESELSRFFVALMLAVYFSIFFFVFYPQRIVLPKVTWLDWTLRLAGPLALMFVLLQVFLEIIPKAVPWVIDGPHQGHHLLDDKGEPSSNVLTVRHGEEEKVRVPPLRIDELKPVERQLEYLDEDSPFYVRSNTGIYLGQVKPENFAHTVRGRRYLRPADRLRLGLYFAGSVGSPPRGSKAVEYLLPLAAEEIEDKAEVRSASGALYRLMAKDMGLLSDCGALIELADLLWRYPTTQGASHLQAIGETYFRMIRLRDWGRLEGEPQGSLEGAALRYYLEYLGSAEHAEPPERGEERWYQAVENTRYLLGVADLDPASKELLLGDLDVLTGAAGRDGGMEGGPGDDGDRTEAARNLRAFADSLPPEPLSCKPVA